MSGGTGQDHGFDGSSRNGFLRFSGDFHLENIVGYDCDLRPLLLSGANRLEVDPGLSWRIDLAKFERAFNPESGW